RCRLRISPGSKSEQCPDFLRSPAHYLFLGLLIRFLTWVSFATYAITVAIEFGLETSVPRVNRAPEFIPHIRTVLVTDGGRRATHWCRVRLRRWRRSWLRHCLLYLRLLWRRWGRDNSRQRVGNDSLLNCPVDSATNSCSYTRDHRDGYECFNTSATLHSVIRARSILARRLSTLVFGDFLVGPKIWFVSMCNRHH